MPKRYPEHLRRQVLDHVAAGEPIPAIAARFGITDQTIYHWRRQTQHEAAQNRIAELQRQIDTITQILTRDQRNTLRIAFDVAKNEPQ